MESYFDKYPYDVLKICVILIAEKLVMMTGRATLQYVPKLVAG